MSFPASTSHFLFCSLHRHPTSDVVDKQYLKSQHEMKWNQNKDPNLVTISWVLHKS